MKFRSPALTALLAAVVHASSPPGGGNYYGGYPQSHPQQRSSYPQDSHGYSQTYSPLGYPHSQGAASQQQHQHVHPTQSTSEPEDAATTADTRGSSDAQDSNVPPPWQEHVDPSSGRPYYYNPETGVTQWERPVDEMSRDGSDGVTGVESTVGSPSDGQAGSGDGAVAVSTNEANVTDEYATSGGDMDPFSSAFAQHGSAGSDSGAVFVSKTEDAPEGSLAGMVAGHQNTVDHASESLQDEKSRPEFGIGSYPMQSQPQSGQSMQQYGTQYGMQIQPSWNEGQARQSWNQQQIPQRQGEFAGQAPSAWNQPQQTQPMNRNEMEKESLPSRTDGQPDQSWNEPQKHMHQDGQAYFASNQQQQQTQQVTRSEQEKEPAVSTTQQQSGNAPGWQTQQGPSAPHPKQQQQSQPLSQQGPPQVWQRQQHPYGQHQTHQPPMGYPVRPGYGIPPHQQQQQYPSHYPQQPAQHGPPQRGPPPYGTYPPQPYQHQFSPYGVQPPPGMSGGRSGVQSGPGAGQLVNQRTEELSAAVREKWGQALMGLGSFGNRTKELAETAKNQIGESASNAGKAIGETSTGECIKIISFMLSLT
ncbi:hypothetical protein HJC23_009313 [Cyclotella cryptica]|uniref:WW domain-containing protein n=1 Tax=Cyclotella cryptica TaxID=29204 RepID=A0ABD3QSI7_9STRA